MNDALLQALLTALGVAPVMFAHYLKFKADTNVSRRKSDNSHTHLKQKIDDSNKQLNNKIDALDKIVKENIQKHEFKDELHNRISRKALNLISAYSDLDSNIVSALNITHVKIRNFAVNYSKSEYRIDKGLIENYIDIEINTIRDSISHALKEAFPGQKDGKYFDEFVKKQTFVDKVTNEFTKTLSENGLNNNAYVRVFEHYITDVMKNIIAGWRLWNNY